MFERKNVLKFSDKNHYLDKNSTLSKNLLLGLEITEILQNPTCIFKLSSTLGSNNPISNLCSRDVDKSFYYQQLFLKIAGIIATWCKKLLLKFNKDSLVCTTGHDVVRSLYGYRFCFWFKNKNYYAR